MINKSELPKNWEVRNLKAIASKIKDGSHNPPASKSLGLPMISAKDIQNNKITFDKPRLISEEEFEIENRRTQIEADDVLLTIVATIGRTAVVPKIFKPFTLQRSVAVIKTSINSMFLCYFFQSKFFQKQLTDSAKGTAQKGVYLKTLSELEIVIPPLAEQERIVAKIEELFSELDAGTTSLKTAARQLKTYRQAVLKWAFEGKLTNENVGEGELPAGWKTTTLTQITDTISDGDHQPPPKTNSGIPFITISNINKVNNAVDFSDTFFVSEDYYKYLNRKPYNGDILYTVTGSFGIPVLINYEKEFCFQRHIGLIRPLESTNQKWLYYLLQSPIVFNQAEKTATGTAQKTVALKSLRNFEIPLCSPEEQQRIVEEIESRLSVCDKLEETISQSLAQSESLRQSILKQAFEGKLVAQDENGEPASVLLERIKQEQEASLEEKQLKKQTTTKTKSKTMAEELKTILQLLKEKGEPVNTHSLWQSSEHKDNIDDFYAEVKELIDNGEIEETAREEKDSFLVLAATK
jgi:type I restriction enzyme S subunit